MLIMDVVNPSEAAEVPEFKAETSLDEPPPPEQLPIEKEASQNEEATEKEAENPEDSFIASPERADVETKQWRQLERNKRKM